MCVCVCVCAHGCVCVSNMYARGCVIPQLKVAGEHV